MRRIREIIESTTEPTTTDCIWIKGNKAMYLTNGQWTYIGESSEGREELEKKIDELDKEVGEMSPKVDKSITSITAGATETQLYLTAKNNLNRPSIIYLKPADYLSAGVMSKYDKEVLGVTESIDISSFVNNQIDQYTTTGTYRIYGERTNPNDGLPILNYNPGHTIEGILKVLDSSISGSGEDTDKVVTQVLTMSNRTGGDGHIWVRTGQGSSKSNLTWSTWEKLQGIFEKNIITTDPLEALNSFTTNGMYSGIFTQPFNIETSENVKYIVATASQFLVVTVNGYNLASPQLGGQTPVIVQTIYLIHNGMYNILQRSGTWDGTRWKYGYCRGQSNISVDRYGELRVFNSAGALVSMIYNGSNLGAAAYVGENCFVGAKCYVGRDSRIDEGLKFTYADGILTITASDGKKTVLTLS